MLIRVGLLIAFPFLIVISRELGVVICLGVQVFRIARSRLSMKVIGPR